MLSGHMGASRSRRTRRCRSAAFSLPHLAFGLLPVAVLLSCRQSDPQAHRTTPNPDVASEPAANDTTAPAAPETSPLDERLKEELVGCWCGRNSSRTCKEYAEGWQEACTPPSDDFLCEPRQRKVLGDIRRPPAPNVETAVCLALESRSATQEERWANTRTSPNALGVAEFPDTQEVRQRLDPWRRRFKHTLVSCSGRLVVLLPAQYCSLVEDIFAELEVKPVEQHCLPELLTAEQWVSACKAKLLRPETCEEAESHLRARCNDTPNEPYCPRPAKLDCGDEAQNIRDLATSCAPLTNARASLDDDSAADCLAAIQRSNSCILARDAEAHQLVSAALARLVASPKRLTQANAHYELAKHHHCREDFAQAEQSYEAVLRLTTTEPIRASALQLLLQLKHERKTEPSEALIDRIVSYQNYGDLPDSLRESLAMSKAGHIYDRTDGKFAACAQQLDDYLETFPHVGVATSNALFNAGNCHFQLGNRAAAIKHWRELKKRYPDFPSLERVRELGVEL